MYAMRDYRGQAEMPIAELKYVSTGYENAPEGFSDVRRKVKDDRVANFVVGTS